MKTRYRIPYGDSEMDIHIDSTNLLAVLSPDAEGEPYERDEGALVRAALQNPIGQKRLSDLAEDKRQIVIVTSDHTRAMPSRITLPILLSEIRSKNNSAQITIMIATGLHRPTTDAEQRRMFGDSIVDNEHIVIHDAYLQQDAYVQMGKLPSGASFCVNRAAAESDLLIAEGFIEPHFFAGFSGGRKSILPGICAKETINENHSYHAISHPHASAGMLEGNPIHTDMVAAGRRVGLDFILNVTLDGQKRITAAFAGDMEQAHEAGVAMIRKACACELVTGDIVVTGNGGYPLDQNLYQTPKAISTAESCAGDDGVIIMCAACNDGFGGDNFEELMLSGTPQQIEQKLSQIPPSETISEQWCAQIFSRILRKHTVVLVSDGIPQEYIRQSNMISAATPDEALEIAYSIKGKEARVVLIPDGVSVLPVRKQEGYTDGNRIEGKR